MHKQNKNKTSFIDLKSIEERDPPAQPHSSSVSFRFRFISSSVSPQTKRNCILRHYQALYLASSRGRSLSLSLSHAFHFTRVLKWKPLKKRTKKRKSIKTTKPSLPPFLTWKCVQHPHSKAPHRTHLAEAMIHHGIWHDPRSIGVCVCVKG